MKLLQSQNVKRNHMKKMQSPAAAVQAAAVEEVLPLPGLLPLTEGVLPLTEGVLPLPGVLPLLPLSAENNNLSL